MSDQRELFDPPEREPLPGEAPFAPLSETGGRIEFADRVGKARKDGSDTMKAAAVSALPRSGTARRRVFDLIGVRSRAGLDGATDDELQWFLEMNPSTERPRRVELVEAGLVEDSGERRRTRWGQQAIVWQLSERGRRVLWPTLTGS